VTQDHGPSSPRKIEGEERTKLLSHGDYLDILYYAAHLYSCPSACPGGEQHVLISGQHIVVCFVDLEICIKDGVPDLDDEFHHDMTSHHPDNRCVWSPFCGIDTIRLNGRLVGTWDRHHQFSVVIPNDKGRLLLFNRDVGKAFAPPLQLREQGSAFVSIPV